MINLSKEKLPIVIFVPYCFIVLLIGMGTLNETYDYYIAHTKGKIANGTIIAKSVKGAETLSEYTFKVENIEYVGQFKFEGLAQFFQDNSSRFKNNNKVKVIYYPKDPTINTLDNLQFNKILNLVQLWVYMLIYLGMSFIFIREYKKYINKNT